MLLSFLAQLSSFCNRVDIKYEEKEVQEERGRVQVAVYRIKCIDMFLYPSLEMSVVVYNPELKNLVSRYISKLQVKVSEQKKKEK
jgi:hypothetical protein